MLLAAPPILAPESSSMTGGFCNKNVFSLSITQLRSGTCPWGAWPAWYRAAATCVVP